jgi:hypothetical protein
VLANLKVGCPPKVICAQKKNWKFLFLFLKSKIVRVLVVRRVVILGVQRLSSSPNGQAGSLVHYVRYEPNILDILSEYSFKIP